MEFTYKRNTFIERQQYIAANTNQEFFETDLILLPKSALHIFVMETEGIGIVVTYLQSRRQSSPVRGAKRLSRDEGKQSLKLSTKAAVFKRVNLFIWGGAIMSIGGPGPPVAPALHI